MRDVNGVLFLDKSLGISSFSLLSQIKVIFNAKKVGHTGTLDPLATGMLPICFGEATKFTQYLLRANKSYRVVAKLGESTDTFDSEGSIVSVRPVIKLNESYLNCVLKTFIGMNYQIPPMFSALKYHGFPLYKYARRNVYVVRTPRLINIYKIDLIRWNGVYLELDIFCSKGMYVRSFVNDLGEYLGCGAHVVSLRRFSIAQFSSKVMVSFKVLQKIFDDNVNYLERINNLDLLLYPIDILVSHFPEINVSGDIYRMLQYGLKISIDKITDFCIIKNCNSHDKDSNLVRMTVGSKKKFFGVGNVNDKYLSVHRLVYFR